jgi:hypothetical protein
MASKVDPNKLKVAELKQELTSRGLDTKGNKPELVARLTAALNTAATPQTPLPNPAPATVPVNTSAAVQTIYAAHTTLNAQQAPTDADVVTATSSAAPADSSEDAIEEGEEEVDMTQFSEADRKRARAERFGIPLQQSDSDKKTQRAARFGLTQSSTTPKSDLTNSDKIEARKKRFGDWSGNAPKKSAHHVNVNIPKAQRLGIPVKGTGLPPSNDDAKKHARLARFGGAQSAAQNGDEERKKQRAERFAGTQGTDVTKRLRVDKPLEQQTNA